MSPLTLELEGKDTYLSYLVGLKRKVEKGGPTCGELQRRLTLKAQWRGEVTRGWDFFIGAKGGEIETQQGRRRKDEG